MTTLVELLVKADQGSEGLLSVRVLEIVDEWLSWWERDAFEHLKWAQSKHIDTGPSMGRLHQIQEIRQGLTDKEALDAPEPSINKTKETIKP